MNKPLDIRTLPHSRLKNSIKKKHLNLNHPKVPTTGSNKKYLALQPELPRVDLKVIIKKLSIPNYSELKLQQNFNVCH